METRPRYISGRCFKTYPIIENEELEKIGFSYLEYRTQISNYYNLGLTDLYNLFHKTNESSNEIKKLRDLHVKMDQVVAAVYGWEDIKLNHSFSETKQGIRFTISDPARREVLKRLLGLNHQLYAEEVKQGLHVKKSQGKGKVDSSKAKGRKADLGGGLFDLQ